MKLIECDVITSHSFGHESLLSVNRLTADER